MTAVYAGLAGLALAGWFRTRRWEKVRGLDLTVAVVAGLAVYVADSVYRTDSLIAAAVVALVLVVVAPPRAWIPLAAVGVFQLAVEPWDQLRLGSLGWFAYEVGADSLGTSGTTMEWVSGESLRQVDLSISVALSDSESLAVPLATFALAAGLVGWAVRRRSIPVALVAVAFGVLVLYSPGAAVLPLAAAALTAYRRDRTYPFFASGVVLLAVVLHEAVLPLGTTRFSVDPVWIWLAGLLVASGLIVWALTRRDPVACVVALAALLVAWPSRPGPAEPGAQFLVTAWTGPVLWPLIFPAALPALVLIAGALVQRRVQLRRNV